MNYITSFDRDFKISFYSMLENSLSVLMPKQHLETSFTLLLFSVAAPGLGIRGGAFEAQHAFWGGAR